jgi:hypothetical protein
MKFLSIAPNDPDLLRKLIRVAPDSVIKAICNAALNSYRGDIGLSAKQKRRLKPAKRLVLGLIDRHKSLKQKRNLILKQKGGAFFIPLLLSTLASTLGPAIISAISGGRGGQAE